MVDALARFAELGGDPRNAVGAVRLAVHGPYPGGTVAFQAQG
ncbi:hypothetical protein [Streptomyces bobili]